MAFQSVPQVLLCFKAAPTITNTAKNAFMQYWIIIMWSKATERAHAWVGNSINWSDWLERQGNESLVNGWTGHCVLRVSATAPVYLV